MTDFTSEEKELARWLDNTSERFKLRVTQDVGEPFPNEAWLLTARELIKRKRKSRDERFDWLFEQYSDLYHKVDKVKVWQASNDVVCELCEEYVIQKLDELKSHLVKDVLSDTTASVATDVKKKPATESSSSECLTQSDSASVASHKTIALERVQILLNALSEEDALWVGEHLVWTASKGFGNAHCECEEGTPQKRLRR